MENKEYSRLFEKHQVVEWRKAYLDYRLLKELFSLLLKVSLLQVDIQMEQT